MGYDRQPHSRDELTIDNNVKVKHFCKDTVSINGASISQDDGNLRRRIDRGALPARVGYVPQRSWQRIGRYIAATFIITNLAHMAG
jgi:hypothetical protein